MGRGGAGAAGVVIETDELGSASTPGGSEGGSGRNPAPNPFDPAPNPFEETPAEGSNPFEEIGDGDGPGLNPFLGGGGGSEAGTEAGANPFLVDSNDALDIALEGQFSVLDFSPAEMDFKIFI